MKFSIELDELQYIVKCLRSSVKVSSADLEGRLSIAIDDTNSLVFSTNISNSIGTIIKTNKFNSDQSGSVGIIYSDLQNFVNSFKPWTDEGGGVKEVFFSVTDKYLLVTLDNFYTKTKKSKTSVKLKKFDHNIYIPKDFEDNAFVLNASMLKAAIDKTLTAVDPIHFIASLRGVNILFTKEFIHFAGSNGAVLSEYSTKSLGFSEEKKYLMSYDFVKGLRNILANLPKEEVQIEFTVSDKLIKATINNIIFYGMLCIGQSFPDYRKELIKAFKHKIVVDRLLLLNTLNPVVGVLDTDDSYRLSVSIDNSKVCLFNDVSNVEFEIEESINDKFIIDVNGKFFRDIVNTIKDEKIIIKFTDDKDNIVLDSEMFEDQKSLLAYIRRRN